LALVPGNDKSHFVFLLCYPFLLANEVQGTPCAQPLDLVFIKGVIGHDLLRRAIFVVQDYGDLNATQDLGLGELQEQYPGKVYNKHFEVDISEGALHFDYKLKAGFSQNLNATFLMEEMGIM